ncbi:acyl-CoA carboxylase subunit epsilon [Streptomyces sp. DSM 40484]|uniref:acyl-CoA carboxylase subunit epsilon n=1 Tax=Streptomyces kroppenstedtii TaxID=3051181 RepID=UPI0028D4C562|nr:acyl-CoA carboxylase epsilon subunit [Streptomyces sp. DSM 40484]
MPATGLLQHPYDTVVEEDAAPGVDVSLALPVPATPPTGDASRAVDPAEAPTPAADEVTGLGAATDGASAAVGRDGTAALGLAGLIRVDRGNPTAEELAAVVTVLLARAAAGSAEDTADSHLVRPSPRWRRFGRGHGYRTAHSWQAGRRPRRAVRGAL